MLKRIAIVILIFTALEQVVQAQTDGKIDLADLPSHAMTWENGNLYRVWINGKYFYTDHDGNVILDLSAFQTVGDFSEGLAPVGTQDEKFGFINTKGEFVIKPVWDNYMPSSNGFVLVAKNTGNYVREDRGEGGVKGYPEEKWYLASNDGSLVDLGMKNAVNIQGTVKGIDKRGIELSIDLSKVNFGYYHPLMKAVTSTNGMPVYHQIEQDLNSISLLTVSSNKLVYVLPFQNYQ